MPGTRSHAWNRERGGARRRALRGALLAGVLALPLVAAGVAEEEPAPGPQGRVERSAFTTAVVDREPQDALEQLANDVRSVSYFTELRGLEGETVTHRWEFGGEVKAEVAFEVGGPRWRVHSTKSLDPSQLGEWTVVVLDSHGQQLSQQSLRYVAAGSASGSAAPASE